MSIDNEIIYRCKRGFLELDLLLNRFEMATLTNMTLNDKLELLRLLEIDDNTLLKLLTKNKKCPSNDMKYLLKLIKEYSNYKSKKKV
ncbi:succinate dehydrogenase assembly factor 2 [Methylophilaceae bacterium]|jgi:succinate dehydrogenase flavin-adding protein (antitoxin of CptAB toxin-antitoxin module)|nr:succinate dehydrogenase assembly factor 2 [Methylophilaceae bacterium]